MTEARRPAHAGVNLNEFWATVNTSTNNVPWSARQFVTEWLEAVASGIDVVSSPELRRAIKERERRLKKGLARLSNPRALETWGGAAGIARLEYRWREGKAAVNDIAAGLGYT